MMKLLKAKNLFIVSTVILGVAAFVIHNIKMVPDADTLFPYRYGLAIMSDKEWLLMVQPGSRIFPEWFYSAFILLLTQNVAQWSDWMLGVNAILLFFSLFYLINSLLRTNPTTAALLAALIMLIFPFIDLLSPSYLSYYLFMHGTHAFYLPYVFFVLGFFIKNLTGQVGSMIQPVAVVLLLSLLLASNALMVVVILLPLLSVLGLQVLQRNDVSRNLKQAALLVAAMLVSVVWSKLLVSFPDQLLFMANDFSYFSTQLIQWLESTKLISQLFDQEFASFWGYLFVLNLLISLFMLIFFKQRCPSSVRLYLGFLLFSVLLFFLANWGTNKGHIRYMIFLILYVPITFVVITHQWLNFSNKTTPLAVTLFFISVAVLSLGSQVPETERKKFKHGLENIYTELEDIQKQYGLSENGLADYWFSQAFYHQHLNVLPISRGRQSDTLLPVLWATNIKSFWQQTMVK
jgi:hypothetical protein